MARKPLPKPQPTPSKSRGIDWAKVAGIVAIIALFPAILAIPGVIEFFRSHPEATVAPSHLIPKQEIDAVSRLQERVNAILGAMNLQDQNAPNGPYYLIFNVLKFDDYLISQSGDIPLFPGEIREGVLSLDKMISSRKDFRELRNNVPVTEEQKSYAMGLKPRVAALAELIKKYQLANSMH
jgi:hypothetical protein